MSTLPFWQDFAPDEDLSAPYTDRYRVRLGSFRLDLPIRVLPNGQQAVSSLLVNQASFRVLDALSAALAEIAYSLEPDLIVGMPTLGLGLAETIARSCDLARYIPLSASRKFWYDERLSAPLSSITSPDKTKRLYMDPNLIPLLHAARRIVIVDDVVSTGASLKAAVEILDAAGIAPCAALCVMTQSERWRGRFPFPVKSCFSSPLFQRTEGGWSKQQEP